MAALAAVSRQPYSVVVSVRILANMSDSIMATINHLTMSWYSPLSLR